MQKNIDLAFSRNIINYVCTLDYKSYIEIYIPISTTFLTQLIENSINIRNTNFSFLYMIPMKIGKCILINVYYEYNLMVNKISSISLIYGYLQTFKQLTLSAYFSKKIQRVEQINN